MSNGCPTGYYSTYSKTCDTEKLMNEADTQPSAAKKGGGTLDVHRGDTYQFGYFLRKTDAHSVVIKTRRFILAPQLQTRNVAQSPRDLPAKASEKERRKRSAPQKKPAAAKPAQKSRKTKGKGRAIASESEEEIIDISDDGSDEGRDNDLVAAGSAPLRRSSRRTSVASGQYREDDEGEDPEADPMDDDIEMTNKTEDMPPPPKPLDRPAFDTLAQGLIAMDDDLNDARVKAEEAEVQLMPPDREPSEGKTPAPGDDASIPLEVDEEEKPKLALRLSYQGFNIHGRAICVIVEPYPPLRAPSTTRDLSLAPMGVVAPRAPSIAPADYIPPSVAAQHRARTPLFLPEDDRERSVTPAPWGQEERVLPPVPLFSEELSPPSFEDGGMYELSQILQSVGGYPAGAAEDDDEIDGAAFFGDADENRGL
ncbi:hypothetical protein BXZ70DRAFT_1004204 [Cristinia sonorae]|uniref:Uncharacterized protein n=1 Tax=Cristinia sonorae TaxID=1940300 RepID=A0A8K0UW63_9AGAR|nr:hypothetical protein BXZ70DRAFT_1004204 [Cristinia sonorae]